MKKLFVLLALASLLSGCLFWPDDYERGGGYRGEGGHHRDGGERGGEGRGRD